MIQNRYRRADLPEAFSPEEEQVCIMCLNNEYRKEAKEALICHNLRLVTYIAEKYKNDLCTQEEIISDGNLGLVKAAETFSGDYHIRFATYAAVCIRNEIVQGIRNAAKNKEISMIRRGPEKYPNQEDPVYQAVEQELLKREVAKAWSDLEQTERLLIELRFLQMEEKNQSQSEVAKVFGMSQSYVSRLEKNVLYKIKNQVKYGTMDVTN